MVPQGMNCRKVDQLLGDSPKTIACWVKRFKTEGLSGLADTNRHRRPLRLDEQQLQSIETALRSHPSQFGYTVNLWDGNSLSHLISKQFDVELGVRQCQHLFRQLVLRLRKPRPLIAKADARWETGV